MILSAMLCENDVWLFGSSHLFECYIQYSIVVLCCFFNSFIIILLLNSAVTSTGDDIELSRVCC